MDMARYRRVLRSALTKRGLRGLLVLLLLCAGGCVYERVVYDGWGDLRRLGEPSKPNVSNPSLKHAATPQPGGWAILLEAFEGRRSQRQAVELIDHLQNQANVPDLWVQSLGESVHVYRGRYDQPDDPRVENDLRQTRMLLLDDQRLFAAASLVPVGVASGASENPLDLRRFAGMYSLQIAVYDDTYGSDFRKAAEKAAATLRADGDEAYFYHGPHRSMVTIGLFTRDDLVQQGPYQTYGPRVEEVQKKYPYNLANGLTQIEKVNGQSIGEQPSFLVRVN